MIFLPKKGGVEIMLDTQRKHPLNSTPPTYSPDIGFGGKKTAPANMFVLSANHITAKPTGDDTLNEVVYGI